MASTELSAVVAVPRAKLELPRPDVAESARSEPGYRLSLLRWLAAVASDDGAVSLAEYEALCVLALEGDSALEMHTVLRAIEHPQAPQEAILGLRAGAAAAPKGARAKSLLKAAPLLRLQGERATGLMRALADALQVELPPDELAACEALGAPSILQSALHSPVRAVKAVTLRLQVDQAVRLTGAPDLARMVDDYLDGGYSLEAVQDRVHTALSRLAAQLSDFEQRLSRSATNLEAVNRDLEAAEQLYKQVSQRLALVEDRIHREKEYFEEDFEEAIRRELHAALRFASNLTDELGALPDPRVRIDGPCLGVTSTSGHGLIERARPDQLAVSPAFVTNSPYRACSVRRKAAVS
jgi:hypothetical protein